MAKSKIEIKIEKRIEELSIKASGLYHERNRILSSIIELKELLKKED